MINRPHIKYEKRLYREGYRAIVGIDEVGRGSWAGPIIAAAVIMPIKPRVYGVRDSKVLTPNKRAELAERIQERASAWAVGIVHSHEIDEYGISEANRKAMLRAAKELPAEPDYFLIDAFKIVGLSAKYAAIAHGDSMVYSIAAASVIAKVYRDSLMEELHEQYPQYGWANNKGYGTAQHQEALDKHGLCPLHRASFHPMKTMV